MKERVKRCRMTLRYIFIRNLNRGLALGCCYILIDKAIFLIDCICVRDVLYDKTLKTEYAYTVKLAIAPLPTIDVLLDTLQGT